MKITEVFSEARIKELLAMPMIQDGHHILGSSSMGRAAICNAAPLMNLAYIDIDTSNEDSNAGTEVHAAIEDTLVDALNSGVAPDGKHEKAAYDAVKATMSGLEEAGWTIKSVDSEKTLLPAGQGIGQGTLDILIIAEKQGKGQLWYGIDIKSGQGACACHVTYFQLLDHARLCFDNGASIVYTNAFSTERSEWLYEVPFKFRKEKGDDNAVRTTINAITAVALSMDAELTPDDEACRYCRGALSGQCPAYVARNRESLPVIMPHEDVTIFAAIELIKKGHVTPAMSAKIDEGKMHLKRAQDYLDGIKSELDGAVKTLGGTENYSVVPIKAGVKVDYKACWLNLKKFMDEERQKQMDELESMNSKPTAEQVRIMPKQKKKPSVDAGVTILPVTHTDTQSTEEKGATERTDQPTPHEKVQEQQTTGVIPAPAPVVAPIPQVRKERKQRSDKGQPRKVRPTQTTLDGGPMGEIQQKLIEEIDLGLSIKLNDVAKVNYYAEYRQRIGKELCQMTADELRTMSYEVSQI